MKFTKIFLFILLAFFITNFSFVSADEVTGSVTVTVTTNYTLTIPASGGTGAGTYGGTAAGSIASGTAVSITATASATSNFTKWVATGAAISCNNVTTSPCAFTMTADASVQAIYTLKPTTIYTVTASISAESTSWGAITAPLVKVVNSGATTTYTITPNTNKYISSITGTCPYGSLVGTTYTTGVISGDCTVIVKFMSGTLSSSVSSCTIALNGSNCTVNLPWTIVNPMTSPTSITATSMTDISVSTLLTTPQSGTANATVIPWGGRTFYLYNNSKLLDQTAIITASCGTNVWDGNKCVAVPSLTTNNVTDITRTTATSGGSIISDGGSAITVSGITWSTSLNPTYNPLSGPISGSVGQKTDGPISGTWIDSMTGLTANTTYHVRAYAKNANGIGYGNDVLFTTLPIGELIVACQNGGTSLNISWPAFVGAQNYTVIRTGTGAPLYSGTGISFLNSGLTLNNTYTYTLHTSGTGGTYGTLTASGTTLSVCNDTTMSGTLTPATSTCTIALNGSSCTSGTLTWTTTNPVATSAVTNNGTATPASPTGNNSLSTFTVPYKTSSAGVTSFYLYNNAVLLATATVTTSCTAGTSWVVNKCANILPVANAGPDKSITLLTTTTSAPTGTSATDTAPGTISSTVWTQVGSTPSVATITNSTTLTPAFSGLSTAGIYTFRLTVTDNNGGTATDDMTVTVSAPSTMSGTLTPATSTCTIALNGSSCTSGTLTWTTTNPVATSAVTNNGTATPASPTGNNSLSTFTVPYKTSSAGVTSFYLYNNAVLLATATVTTSCGTNVWDTTSSTCKAPSLTMSGALTPATSTCTIALNGSSCTSGNLTWTTTNPVATSAITNNGTATPASPTGNNSLSTFTVPYKTSSAGVTSFYLYNNAVLLATATVTTSCTAGTTWNGNICAAGLAIPNLTLTCLSQTLIVASWNPVVGVGATNYRLFRDGNSVVYTQGTTYNDQGLTPNTTYTYTIMASDFVGNSSSYSTPISKITNASCVPNTLPVANAGPDKNITLPIQISAPTGATAIDTAPGTISSTVWTQVGSTPSVATIGSSTTLTPSFSGLSTAGIYTFRLTATDNNGGTGTDDMTVTVSAASTMSGTLTSSASSCTIALNANSCPVTLTWGIINPETTPTAITAPGMTNINVTNTLTTPQSGTSTNVAVPYSSKTFYLYNNKKSLVPTSSGIGITVTSNCGTNVWDTTSGTCKAPVSATTGWITIIGCVIDVDKSKCEPEGGLKWNTYNPVGTSISIVKAGSATVITGNSNTSAGYPYGYLYSISFGETIFSLNNNGILQLRPATATCANTTHWDSAPPGPNTTPRCVPNALTTEFTATPDTIFKGRSATLTWDSPLATSCTGTWASATDSGTWSTGDVPSNSTGVPVFPLVTTQYTLTCTNSTSTSSKDATTQVIIINIKEN